MSDTTPAPLCGNPDCRIAVDGRCVEGFTAELSSCPFYGRAPAEATDVEPDRERVARGPTLPAGEPLSAFEAGLIAAAGETRVMAFVGANDAGKTTLVAAFSEAFQRGRFADHVFEGSTTLFAFERVCHLARAASRRAVAKTERTGRASPLGFYHLALALPLEGRRVQLLLADRAGEDYRGVADLPGEARNFLEMLRADHVTVLVDGERLSDPTQRHNVVGETRLVLEAFKDAGVLRLDQQVHVVLTKLDLVQASAGRAKAEAAYDRLVAEIQDLLAGVVGRVGAFRIAAMPTTGDLPIGHGVDALLRAWTARSAPRPFIVQSAVQSPRRFARYVGPQSTTIAS